VPIKILLEADGYSNKMNTTTKHVPDSTTQVGQDHVATGVLLVLGTNTHLPKQNTLTRIVEIYTACCLCYTSQTNGLRWSDRWTGPVRPVATALHRKRSRKT
jgi:hypothetical protein